MTEEQFLTDPMEWPNWPVLPLIKLNDHKVRCGLIVADGNFKVYKNVNMFGLHEVPGKTWGEKLKNFETVEYATAAELLKEWRID